MAALWTERRLNLQCTSGDSLLWRRVCKIQYAICRPTKTHMRSSWRQSWGHRQVTGLGEKHKQVGPKQRCQSEIKETKWKVKSYAEDKKIALQKTWRQGAEANQILTLLFSLPKNHCHNGGFEASLLKKEMLSPDIYFCHPALCPASEDNWWKMSPDVLGLYDCHLSLPAACPLVYQILASSSTQDMTWHHSCSIFKLLQRQLCETYLLKFISQWGHRVPKLFLQVCDTNPNSYTAKRDNKIRCLH